jgi:hypothetical protein
MALQEGNKKRCRASRQAPSGPPQTGGKPGATKEGDEAGALAKRRGESQNAQPLKTEGCGTRPLKNYFNGKSQPVSHGDFFTRIGEFRPSVSTSFPLSFGA